MHMQGNIGTYCVICVCRLIECQKHPSKLPRPDGLDGPEVLAGKLVLCQRALRALTDAPNGQEGVARACLRLLDGQAKRLAQRLADQ